MPIDIINITDIQADETNVNWFANGERANALVLNRPVKEVSAKVNETIGVTNTLQTDVGVLQTDVGVLQTDVGTLQGSIGTVDVGVLDTEVNTLQNNVGTLQTDVGVLQTDVNTLEQDFLDYKLNVTTTLINKTLVDREFCYVRNPALTISLPLNPTVGTKVGVGVQDYENTIISRNGEPIMRLAQDMTINKQNVTVTLLYVSATEGWRIV